MSKEHICCIDCGTALIFPDSIITGLCVSCREQPDQQPETAVEWPKSKVWATENYTRPDLQKVAIESYEVGQQNERERYRELVYEAGWFVSVYPNHPRASKIKAALNKLEEK